MLRQIIKIDQKKCDGCGLCVNACHEGAIALVNGKAKLVRENHCDGLGDCLPACPAGAISFVTKDALPFTGPADDLPVMVKKCDCVEKVKNAPGSKGDMTRWPIQLKLVDLKAPFFANADILIASDCAAYVCADFHKKYIKDRVILIGCPKLDREEYGFRLSEIINNNDIKTITVVRLDIPCCSAMARMAREGMALSKKTLPMKVITLRTDGTEAK